MSEPNELDAGAVSDEMVERAMKAHNLASQTAVMEPHLIGIRSGVSFSRQARKACMRAALEAALTAAPPDRHAAPGVTAAWLDARIAEERQRAVRALRIRPDSAQSAQYGGRVEAFKEVRNLLTAQPEVSACAGRGALALIDDFESAIRRSIGDPFLKDYLTMRKRMFAALTGQPDAGAGGE